MSNLKTLKAGIAVVFVALVAYMVVDPCCRERCLQLNPSGCFRYWPSSASRPPRCARGCCVGRVHPPQRRSWSVSCWD